MGLGRPFTVTTDIKPGERVHDLASARFTEAEGDLLVQGCIAAMDNCDQKIFEVEAYAAAQPGNAHLQETSKRFVEMTRERRDVFVQLQVKLVRLLVEGKGEAVDAPSTTNEPGVVVKHVYAKNVVKGDRAQTSTGMRTVLRTIPIDGDRVAIVVQDPATASGESELRYKSNTNVLVHRKVG